MSRRTERTAMVGGGYYNRNSTLQALVAERCGALVSPADVQAQHLTLVDYGCSEGSNSIRLIGKALTVCPEDSTVTMVFNDTPANDYISLAATIDRFLQDPETRQSARKLMPLMAPQSYYQQIVPEASVDVGFSTATLHWIGRLQPTAPDWLPADADVAAEVLADICCFLRSRHREVRRGGHLLLSFPVAGALSLECAYPSIFQCLHDLSRDGVISPDAASHFRLPFHFRTAAEIQQALDAVRAEWAVVEHFTLDVDHPAFLQFHATLPEGPDAVPDALALQAYSQAISAGFVAIIGNTVVDTAKRFPLAVDAPAALALGSHPEAVIREQMAARLQERLQQSTFWQTPLGNKYVFLKLRKI